LFFVAGNIGQTFHSLQYRVIGHGVVKVLPVTVLLMGLAAAAAIGLPPFGLFFSELTIISGGFAAGKVIVSVLILLALIASFCGVLQQLSRILPGVPKPEFANNNLVRRFDGVPAMAFLLGTLLVFSVWLPAPLLQGIHQAADIIGGKR
jgi:hydrogenase-4 component F